MSYELTHQNLYQRIRMKLGWWEYLGRTSGVDEREDTEHVPDWVLSAFSDLSGRTRRHEWRFQFTGRSFVYEARKTDQQRGEFTFHRRKK